MIQRCTNPKMAVYKYYGGRGISVCEQWRDFRVFIKDMGERPSPLHTLERKDVNGNYDPSNCVWADWKTQAINRRLYNTNRSGYRGVVPVSQKKRQAWLAQVFVDYTNFHVGHFDDVEEAAWMRDQWALALHGEDFAKLNFDYAEIAA